MIEINYIRENKDEVIQRLSLRNLHNVAEDVERIFTLDIERRKIITRLEELRAEMNTLSKSIGVLMAQGSKQEAESARARTAKMKEDTGFFEESLEKVEKDLDHFLVALPNTPHISVPPGKTPEQNMVVYRNEISDIFPDWMIPHWDLAKQHGIIDFDLGSKITGAGFPVYIGKGAKIQRALISFFISK